MCAAAVEHLSVLDFLWRHGTDVLKLHQHFSKNNHFQQITFMKFSLANLPSQQVIFADVMQQEKPVKPSSRPGANGYAGQQLLTGTVGRKKNPKTPCKCTQSDQNIYDHFQPQQFKNTWTKLLDFVLFTLLFITSNQERHKT